MARTPLHAVFLLSFALGGCGSPVTSAKTTGPAYDPANPGGTSDPVVGVNDGAGIFVKVSSDTATTLVTHRAAGTYSDLSHPTTNLSQECRINHDATGTDKDILCISEVEELDLYFSDLKVQYHVPRDMCHYVISNPYHFYDLEPGVGLTAISYDKSATGTISNPIGVDGEGNPQCNYDYTDVNGPNCCIGNYTKTVDTTDLGGVHTISVTKGTWGGKTSACLFGPATYLQAKNAAGFPKPDIFNVENVGLNRSYTLKAGINLAFNEFPVNGNISVANFYNFSDDPASTIPSPIKPKGMQAAGSYTPSDTYDFTCLDSAQEIKYRIRLMIREWNQSPIVEGGDPDVSGNDTDGTPLNDRLDWKDVPIGSYPADTYL